ncbi:MAG: ribosome recycling factor [Streptococcaceae bacterium]|jgi:ribosome recycling factor|nr:ribosome recycling factor [Streptococcaceae bacterium]
MANELLNQLDDKNKKRLESLARVFGQIRAGRANASLLDRIQVTYYGVPTPLNQLASITIPEARVLLVTPFDKSSIKDIEHEISASDLGITPANDGNVIRLVIPQLTEERRKELAKEVKKEAEEAKVSIRNNRRDILEIAKKQQKTSEITEDDLRTIEKEVQAATDKTVKEIDALIAEKSKELLEV